MTEEDRGSLLRQLENRGYYLLPKSHPRSPGYTGVLVAVREAPTRMHFDPESMRVEMVSHDGMPNRMTLGFRLPAPESQRVCVGSVVLSDREHKGGEFFTFGGPLESVSVPGETVYSLRSAAPILELTMQETPAHQLAAEAEAQIARARAKTKTSDQGFAWRLAHVDALQLYIATIHSVFLAYQNSPNLQEASGELYEIALAEKYWLEQMAHWPVRPSTVQELLSH